MKKTKEQEQAEKNLSDTVQNLPKGVLKTKEQTNWKPCLFCNGEIVQVRKALFTCLNCNQEYISTEEDMEK